MNIKEFINGLKKRLPLIILVTIAFIAISGTISYTMMKPVYEASTQILVNQDAPSAEEFRTQDIDANVQLISTYNDIIKSPVILAGVIEKLGLNESVKSLNERISVSSIEGSQVVTVEVEDASMEGAVLIANTTASIFESEIKNLMKVDNVNIIWQAEMPANPEPVRPDPLFNMAIGAVVGFMLGTGLAILLDQMNTTIRTEEDIEEIVGLQVLGIVSPVRGGKELKKTAGNTIREELSNDVEDEKVQPVNSAKIGGTY